VGLSRELVMCALMSVISLGYIATVVKMIDTGSLEEVGDAPINPLVIQH
jgi:hypothetical protein